VLSLKDPNQIKVLSIGTGNYPVPRYNILKRFIRGLWPFELLKLTMESGANSQEKLAGLLFDKIKTLRINDEFSDSKYATDLMESNVSKLKKLQVLGRESFGLREDEIVDLLT